MTINDTLSSLERRLLLAVAKYSIIANLQGEPLPHLTALVKEVASPDEIKDIKSGEVLDLRSGAFVSVYVDGRLRGCIGNFREDQYLWEVVQKMAVHASTQDPRFPPIQLSEASTFRCEISALTPAMLIKDIEDIKVGRDGLIIEQGYNRGVLLPQVPVEHQWDRDEFLAQTCIKAALPYNAWSHPDTKIFRFQAIVFSDRKSSLVLK